MTLEEKELLAFATSCDKAMESNNAKAISIFMADE